MAYGPFTDRQHVLDSVDDPEIGYIARRVAESHGLMEPVVAASIKKAAGAISTAWNTALHPRGRDGRFIKKGQSVNLFDSSGTSSKPAVRGKAVGVYSGPDGKDLLSVEITKGGTFQGKKRAVGDVVEVSPKQTAIAPDSKGRLKSGDIEQPLADGPPSVEPVKSKAKGPLAPKPPAGRTEINDTRTEINDIRTEMDGIFDRGGWDEDATQGLRDSRDRFFDSLESGNDEEFARQAFAGDIDEFVEGAHDNASGNDRELLDELKALAETVRNGEQPSGPDAPDAPDTPDTPDTFDSPESNGYPRGYAREGAIGEQEMSTRVELELADLDSRDMSDDERRKELDHLTNVLDAAKADIVGAGNDTGDSDEDFETSRDSDLEDIMRVENAIADRRAKLGTQAPSSSAPVSAREKRIAELRDRVHKLGGEVGLDLTPEKKTPTPAPRASQDDLTMANDTRNEIDAILGEWGDASQDVRDRADDYIDALRSGRPEDIMLAGRAFDDEVATFVDTHYDNVRQSYQDRLDRLTSVGSKARTYGDLRGSDPDLRSSRVPAVAGTPGEGDSDPDGNPYRGRGPKWVRFDHFLHGERILLDGKEWEVSMAPSSGKPRLIPIGRRLGDIPPEDMLLPESGFFEQVSSNLRPEREIVGRWGVGEGLNPDGKPYRAAIDSKWIDASDIAVGDVVWSPKGLEYTAIKAPDGRIALRFSGGLVEGDGTGLAIPKSGFFRRADVLTNKPSEPSDSKPPVPSVAVDRRDGVDPDGNTFRVSSTKWVRGDDIADGDVVLDREGKHWVGVETIYGKVALRPVKDTDNGRLTWPQEGFFERLNTDPKSTSLKKVQGDWEHPDKPGSDPDGNRYDPEPGSKWIRSDALEVGDVVLVDDVEHRAVRTLAGTTALQPTSSVKGDSTKLVSPTAGFFKRAGRKPTGKDAGKPGSPAAMQATFNDPKASRADRSKAARDLAALAKSGGYDGLDILGGTEAEWLKRADALDRMGGQGVAKPGSRAFPMRGPTGRPVMGKKADALLDEARKMAVQPGEKPEDLSDMEVAARAPEGGWVTKHGTVHAPGSTVPITDARKQQVVDRLGVIGTPSTAGQKAEASKLRRELREAGLSPDGSPLNDAAIEDEKALLRDRVSGGAPSGKPNLGTVSDLPESIDPQADPITAIVHEKVDVPVRPARKDGTAVVHPDGFEVTETTHLGYVPITGGQLADLSVPGSSSAPHLVVDPVTNETVFTPERQEGHKAIIASFLRGILVPEPDAQRTQYTLGGGPASGKSTGQSIAGIPDAKDRTVVIADPDALKLAIAQQFGEPYDTKSVDTSPTGIGVGHFHEESSYLSKLLADAAIAAGLDLILDGTGDGGVGGQIAKQDKARAAGYRVQGMYMSVPIDQAVIRDGMRSRTVGAARVSATTRSVATVFPKIIDGFDHVEVYDNRGPKGAPAVLVFRKDRGGEPEILDEQLYQEFLDRANEPIMSDEDGAALVEQYKIDNPK